MYILGINAYHADVSAVLLKDGVVLAALEEERFQRIKHVAGFPTRAIQRCLDIAEIKGADINKVAVSRDPRANLWQKAWFTLRKRPEAGLVRDRLRSARRIGNIRGPLANALGVAESALPALHSVEHHPSHLASAFYCSPFEDASVCAIDGFGDFVSTSYGVGTGSSLRVLERTFFPHSLGILYTAVTQFLGFPNYGDEFKVMGLAPYGSPTRVDELRRLIRLKPKGAFELDLKYFRHWSGGIEADWEDGYPKHGRLFSPELERLLGPAREPGAPLDSQAEDLARSLQAVYEECAMHVLNGLWERTKDPRLCLAGGCAMNSVANGKVRSETPFTDVYIQPAAGDNGTALGAAQYLWHNELRKPRAFQMRHGYWGTSYPDADVSKLLGDAGRSDSEFIVKRCTDEAQLCDETASLLVEGNVVGWFQGRMEWGARALGNRSILADPRRADMRDLINLKIKFREKFRPFAPSVAEEVLHDFFIEAAPDAFMQQVYPIRPERQADIPAITHVDGTGRLQTVSPSTNPLYYRLIRTFGNRTGIPILLNTSFNENEPIVDTPAQALDCFLRTRMDVVVIGNTIVQRRPGDTPAA